MAKRSRIILVTILILGCLTIYANGLREWRYSARAMGTDVSITLVGTPIKRVSGRMNRLFRIALEEIVDIEKTMSIYRPGSDVSILNSTGLNREVAVDSRTFEVIRAAAAISRLTRGAFNICVLPVEEAWGFKTGDRRMAPRSAPSETRSYSHDDISLKLDGNRHLVKFLKEGMKIDLGGIAKGYAVDRAIAALKGNGVRDALVDIGGDCYCLGKNADGRPWRIGLRHPRHNGVLTVLSLVDRAVATSGDYEDFFFEDGVRYSHLFDPRTGRPARSGVISATVISPSCTQADALATAIAVMGERGGLKLIEEMEDTECIIVSDGKELQISTSSGATVN